MNKKSLIYNWRVDAMLLYIRRMVDNDKPKDEIKSVIDGYIEFTERNVDATLCWGDE